MRLWVRSPALQKHKANNSKHDFWILREIDGKSGALKRCTSGQCFLVALVKRAQQDRSFPASPVNDFLSIKDTAGVPTVYAGVDCSHSSPPGFHSSWNTPQPFGCVFFLGSLLFSFILSGIYGSTFFFSRLNERFVFCSFSASIDRVKVSYLCLLKCHAVFFWGSWFCCCVPQSPVTSVGCSRKSGGRNGRF